MAVIRKAPRTRSSAISARALVAEIGADSVRERVTERNRRSARGP